MRVYINNRNLLTWPEAMALRLADQGHEPVFVDNASDWPPLLAYYRACRFEVRQLGQNIGAAGPWLVLSDEREPYAVTDPDLDLFDVPADWPEVLTAGIALRGVKCGLSLWDVDRVPAASCLFDAGPESPEMVAYSKEVIWGKRIEDGFFDYPVDTTFAVYDPRIRTHQIGGCRAAPPYTAYHLPWHLVLDPEPSGRRQVLLDDEYANYVETCQTGANVARTPGMKKMVAEFRERAAEMAK